MRETLEREIKLSPGTAFVMPLLGAPLPSRVFVTTYHDTADLRLARRGLTLRYRVEDGAGLWQLKLPHGSNTRVELELPGSPAEPPAGLRSLLTAHLRNDPLVPVARLRTRRDGVRTADAEIVEDNVSVMDGIKVARRFRELEVELLHGDESTLRRIEQELRAAGAEAAIDRPKLHRALDLAEPPTEIVVPEGASPREAVQLALKEQGRRMLVHDPGTRLGSDPEDLHQLRVATRRARAFLRSARSVVGRPWADALRGELAAVGSALGPMRDLDVLTERLQSTIAEIGADPAGSDALLATLGQERDAARIVLFATLDGEPYLDLVARLDTLEKDDVPKVKDAPSLHEVWQAEVRRARRFARGLDASPPDESLHELRIHVKRARYAADLAAHELGAKGKKANAAAKAMQEVLGDHQDACVAQAYLEAWAPIDPAAADLAVRLIEVERERQETARAAWPEAWSVFEKHSKA